MCCANRAQENAAKCQEQIQVAMNDFITIASSATELDGQLIGVSEVI